MYDSHSLCAESVVFVCDDGLWMVLCQLSPRDRRGAPLQHQKSLIILKMKKEKTNMKEGTSVQIDTAIFLLEMEAVCNGS